MRDRTFFRRLSLFLALGWTAWNPAVEAGDWPQFRGSNRDGVSPETGLLRSFPESGPAVLWRVPLGTGFSGVAAVGDKLFTMDSRGEKEYALCLARSDGHELWRAPVGALFREATGDGPRSMPAVEGDLLWVVGSQGDLVALRAESGEKLWSVDIRERFGTELPPFGFAMMPLVVGDQVVLGVGGGERALAAFDKRTGELAWQAPAGPLAYSSPIHVTWNGTEQLLFLDQSHLVSISPAGEPLWSLPFADPFLIKVVLPVFVPPDLVFVSASYDYGAMVVRLEKGEGGKPAARTVWESRVMRNHFNTSVAHDGLVYGFDNATLKCIDATSGETRWAKRGGFGKGSLIYADGHLWVLTEHGRLILAEATGEGYRQKASAQLFDTRTWTPPSLADRRLYLRSQEELVSLDVATGGARTETARGSGEAIGPKPAGASTGLDAREILARHLEARGGAEALSRIETVRISGRFHHNGEEYPFTIYRRRPDRYRFEAHSPDGPLMIEAWDGEKAWRENLQLWQPFAGKFVYLPRAELSPEERPLFLEDEVPFDGPLLGAQTAGLEVRLVGTEELDGVAVFHLRVELDGGRSQHWWLDRRDFSIVKRTARHLDQMGYHEPYDRVWFTTRYREVAGVRFPSSWEREDFQLVRIFEVSEIEINVELDDALFSPPGP